MRPNSARTIKKRSSVDENTKTPINPNLTVDSIDFDDSSDEKVAEMLVQKCHTARNNNYERRK